MFQSDRGGALVIWRNNAWTQIGVSSFNPSAGCASGQPDGFSRVTAYLTWIRDMTGLV
jgi:secreted trypsin-like serine protease